jgi:hypothetical protein
MKISATALILCALAGLAAPRAFAADACYSRAELEAEQLLRLHSELMVITVACRQSSQGANLVPAYTGFTQNNIGILHKAEQTMINFYHKLSGHDGTPQLDTLRTKLGNEFGQQMANMSAQAFCLQNRDKVIDLYSASAEQVQGQVEQMAAATPSYGHLCRHAESGAQDKGQTVIAKANQ